MVTPEDNVKCTFMIGKFNFDNGIQEGIGYSKKKFQTRKKSKPIGECKVEIYELDDDGIIPHMHIFNADRSFDACVCVYSNHYYSHGGKYTSKFSASQCKAFHEWMQKQNRVEIMKATNWQCVAMLWEVGNPNCTYPIRRKVRKQPNYEIMTDFTQK